MCLLSALAKKKKRKEKRREKRKQKKNLAEAKLESYGLTALAEIFRQPSIDCVAWILLATLM